MMGRSENVFTSAHNLIATGTVIKGEINSNCDIRIDGSVEGSIVSKGKVLIGDKGVINGEIKATNIDIMGAVTGNVFAAEIMTLKSSSKLNGNISTQTLVIEHGAQFNGNCKMGKEALPNQPLSKDQIKK